MNATPPLLITYISDSAASSYPQVRAFASSLMRSLYGGRILIFRDTEKPLFKVERKQVEEIIASKMPINSIATSDHPLVLRALLGLSGSMKPEPRQWIIVASPASLALRNIDHLIPGDSEGAYPRTELDFLWAKAERMEGAGTANLARRGLWAVRGEYLSTVLDCWREASNRPQARHAENEVWDYVVKALPLRKGPFEKGEVITPPMGAVDWEAVSSAAFVTLPDWPEKEAWRFLQGLYFETYLGDQTGMILNLFEP